MKPAGSPNDPITPHLFREGFPVLAPYVRNIINDNLRTGTVPTYFNHAGVTPLIKNVFKMLPCFPTGSGGQDKIYSSSGKHFPDPLAVGRSTVFLLCRE